MLPSSASGIIPSMQAIQAETTAMCARTPLKRHNARLAFVWEMRMRNRKMGELSLRILSCAAATNRSTLKIRVSEFRYDRHWLGYLPAFPSTPSLSSPLTPEKKNPLHLFRLLVKLRTDDPGKGGFDGIFQLFNTCIFAVLGKPWASSRPITSARDERVGEDPRQSGPE